MSSRGMPVTESIRAGRRAAAEKRQEAYDKLSLAEKLAKLPPEPHAAKVRAKLLAASTQKATETLKDESTEEVKVKNKKGNRS